MTKCNGFISEWVFVAAELHAIKVPLRNVEIQYVIKIIYILQSLLENITPMNTSIMDLLISTPGNCKRHFLKTDFYMMNIT